MKNLDASLPFLQIDPHQMEQVVINLLINAMDAMPEGGDIELSTIIKKDNRRTASPAKALITIKDEGAGIPQEHMQSIFDPFFSTKETGTGLGLPISLGIVESHGGQLSIKSQKDKGTTVIIELAINENHLAKEVKDEKEDPDR